MYLPFQIPWLGRRIHSNSHGAMTLMVKEPLELLMLWNLLEHSHKRKIHRGLGLLCLHM